MTSPMAMMELLPESLTRPDPKASLSNAASHPSMCESYLLSPLETILESLDDHDWEYITCHDITEAYNVLSTRICAIAPSILYAEELLPALIPLKERAASLARALKRDIRRALVNPSHNPKPSLYDSYLSEISLADHDIQHTIDLSTLCHFSLRVLSDIFAFRVLYLLFPVRELNELLHEVLKITSVTDLPTLNASKTVSLVYWIIQSQQLPSSILEPRKAEIISALRHGLNGQRGLQAKCDSLKAVNSILKRQHALFVTHSLGFLFTILTNLAVNEAECRLQACNALSGLVLAKFCTPDFPHEVISQEIHAFLKPQIPFKNSKAPSRDDFPLHYYLTMALNLESSDTKDPVWAVITLAALIALSDRWLYTRVDFRFFANGLFPALCHRRQEVRQLAIAAWGGLVWTFTLLPAKHPAWRQPEDPALPDTGLSIRGRAFRFLKDDVKGEKGVLLVRGLLLPRSGGDGVTASLGDVSRALLVIKVMIGGDQAVDYEVGVRVLSRLVSAIGSNDTKVKKCDDVRPSMDMFEGTLMDANSCKVNDIAQHVSTMRLDRVRALSEAEIQRHWMALVETWEEAVERTLALHVELPRSLLDVWQSLLLVKADLTQERQHLMVTGTFASQIADTITRFLLQSQEIPVQIHRLIVVKRLWSVMKNVFATSWLPAEKILANVLKINFFLEEEQIKAAWSDLCADLISVGIPTLLHVLSTGSEGQKVTRQLWTVLARTWQVPDEKAHWEELVSFLVIPLKSWMMSGAEIKLWEAVLRSSMSMAHFDSVQSLMVVDRFIRRLGDNGTDALVAFPRGVSALLGYIDLSGCTVLPQNVIIVIDRTLFSNYPPRAEFLAACLEIIRHLGKMLAVVPRMLLVQFLTIAEKGICCWIGDEKAAMLTREHDLVVQELYCSTLRLLRELPPSLETLIAVSPFLSSAFGRLSSSAIGPLSFNEYWHASYHGIEEYTSSYPDCLKACLLGYSDAFGGSIAEGLSISQGTDSSPIPDSQSFYVGRQKTWSSRDAVSRESWQPSPVIPPVKPKKLPSPKPPVKRRRVESPPRVKKMVSPLQSPALTQLSFDCEQSVLDRPSERISSSPPLIPNHDGSGKSSRLSTPRLTPQPMFKDSVLRKRSPGAVPESRLSKRRKTESDLDPDRPFSQSMLRDLPGRRHSGSASRTPVSPQVPFHSPPVALGPVPSAREHRLDHLSPLPEVSVPPDLYSQSTDTRKRKRVADWVNSYEALQNSGPRSSASQASSSGPSSPVCPGTRMRVTTPTSEVDEEYDTWEAGAASLQEIMELQRELVGSDNFVPETDDEEFEVGTDYDSGLENLLGRSRLEIPGSRLEPNHSRTVPKRPASTPLRRTRTTSPIQERDSMPPGLGDCGSIGS